MIMPEPARNKQIKFIITLTEEQNETLKEGYAHYIMETKDTPLISFNRWIVECAVLWNTSKEDWEE